MLSVVRYGSISSPRFMSVDKKIVERIKNPNIRSRALPNTNEEYKYLHPNTFGLVPICLHHFLHVDAFRVVHM
jgi:hypothetical protein